MDLQVEGAIGPSPAESRVSRLRFCSCLGNGGRIDSPHSDPGGSAMAKAMTKSQVTGHLADKVGITKRAASFSSRSLAALLVMPTLSARCPVTCDLVIAFAIALPPGWLCGLSILPPFPRHEQKRNRLTLLSAGEGPIAPSTCRSMPCPLRMASPS